MKWGALSAPFWCLCQKLSLSLYFNKIYYTKALSNWALSLALDWIPLLPRPRIPAVFMFQQQPFTAISSSVVPFSCLQSFPASGCFPMSQFFASGGQSIGVFSISPSNEYSGLTSFRIDWLDLLAIQGTRNSFPIQSSKASVLQRLAFFMVQLSYPYMTTGKTIALTRWTFVGNAMSLLLNMLSRLVITFLPRGKDLLISWLQAPSAVILEPPKTKSLTVSIVSHLFAMKWWD